jgi:hypothetical protein
MDTGKAASRADIEAGTPTGRKLGCRQTARPGRRQTSECVGRRLAGKDF